MTPIRPSTLGVLKQRIARLLAIPLACLSRSLPEIWANSSLLDVDWLLKSTTLSPSPRLEKLNERKTYQYVVYLTHERFAQFTASFDFSLAAQGETSPASSLADPTHLVELLQLLFPAFCMHFNAFMLVLNTIRKIKERNASVPSQFLDALSEEQIWGYIQIEARLTWPMHMWELWLSHYLTFPFNA